MLQLNWLETASGSSGMHSPAVDDKIRVQIKSHLHIRCYNLIYYGNGPFFLFLYRGHIFSEKGNGESSCDSFVETNLLQFIFNAIKDYQKRIYGCHSKPNRL